MDLMCIMVLPGVVIGGAVASFTRQAQRAARAFLLAELVWLLDFVRLSEVVSETEVVVVAELV